MGLFSKNKHEKTQMNHCEGLPLRKDCPIVLELDTDRNAVVFTEFGKKQEILLPISKITRTGILHIETVESGSMIGRAIVGGVLYGGAGAIIGAMTAQEKKKVKHLYSINYLSDGEEKAIVMKSAGAINEMKFRRMLDDLLPQSGKADGPVTL